jgi:hypothetical protein
VVRLGRVPGLEVTITITFVTRNEDGSDHTRLEYVFFSWKGENWVRDMEPWEYVKVKTEYFAQKT